MQKVTEYVSEMIKIPSISPFGKDENQRTERFKVCSEVIDYLDEILRKTGAETKKLVFEGGHDKWWYPVPNLYAEIRIGNPQAENHKFICYMGHVDVVPAGDENLWRNSPFSGKIQDGFVHGRGATDMKGSVGAWVNAIESLKNNIGDNVNLTIGTLITADEEWAAVNGSDKVLQWMKENHKEPDAFVVGEPSSEDYLGTHLKIGRRGSLVGYIEAKGVQGHRAYDDLFVNPNRALAYAMVVLNAKTWKDGNRYFPNTTFEAVAIESGDFNASAVIPEKAKTLWNVRFTDKQTKDKIVQDLNEILQNPPAFLKKHPDYAAAKDAVITANLEVASEPYYSEPSTLAQSASVAIKSVLNVESKFDGSGGTTDGRFVHKYFPKAQIIELGVPEKGGIIDNLRRKDYGKRGGMHQIDERASIKDLVDLSRVYAATVNNFARGGR